MSRALSLFRQSKLSAAAVIPTAPLFVSRFFATEHDLGVPGSPRPSEPFVEEDNQGKNQGFDRDLEDKMKKYSGTAEDVTVKDAEKGSMKKMAADPSDVEKGYKEKAFDVAKSAYERSPREN